MNVPANFLCVLCLAKSKSVNLWVRRKTFVFLVQISGSLADADLSCPSLRTFSDALQCVYSFQAKMVRIMDMMNLVDLCDIAAR